MVHGCMVDTELAPRRLQFHVAPAMPALEVHHFGIFYFFLFFILFKKRAIKKLVSHVEPHASAMSLLKRAENSAI